MRLLKSCGAFLLVALSAHPAAAAANKSACIAAASKSQQLRDAHKLVEAREQLRICTSSDCPSVIQADCVAWMTDVDRALPTVVVTAKSGGGRDLLDLKITVDGQPLVTKLDGQAVPMNPGLRVLHVEAPDGTTLDQQVLVREGGKDQPIQLVVGPVPAVAPVPSPAVVETPKASASTSSLRTAGWTVGGVGVAGLVVGAIFSVLETTSKSSHCTNDVCDPGSTSGIRSDALVANIGWVAGGVLLAGGAAIVLFAPKPHDTLGASVKLAPTFSAGGSGLALGGSF